MERIERLLSSYPRQRPPLPDAYERIREREYVLNRRGGTLATSLAMQAERWMHRIIAKRGRPGAILEIGAGTLNHVPYETGATVYDVVEPFDVLYAGNPMLERVHNVYRDLSEVPTRMRYDRVISIAVLEHLENLPAIVASAALRLSPRGLWQHAIPSEGGALWGLGWRLTTGIAYRLRNKLPYDVAMRHEHINEAPEIVAIIHWFFERVRVERFPLPLHHASLYTYIEATGARFDRCEQQLRGF